VSLDRIKQLVSDLVEHFVGARVDYMALYPCTVAGQSGNELELIPDDERMRGFGLSGITLRAGLPGFLATVPVGARCLLGFDAGDPKRPYAALWDEGAVTSVVFDSGSLPVARATDPTASGTITLANTAGPNSVVITYTPLVGAPVVATITSAGVLAVAPNPTTFTLGGAIVSGNTKLTA